MQRLGGEHSLQIAVEADGLRFMLFEHQGTELIPRGREAFCVDFDELDERVADLRFLLGRSNLVGEMGAAAAEDVLRLAMLLFDGLIPPAIKPWLREGRGTLTLLLDANLQGLPWELLHNGEDFLCRQFALSRRVIEGGIVAPTPSRKLSSSRRVLLLADPREDLPAAAREGCLLTELFSVRRDVELGYVGAPILRSTVRESLREYDIVHLAGHAESSDEGTGWLLADGRFEADDIERLMGTRQMPALVFANACSTANGRWQLGDPMAHVMLRAGVLNYLGTLWEIPDDIGVVFALEFYEQLMQGLAIAEALRRTRVELARQFGDATVLWGSYVLYGSAGQQYFQPSPAPAPYLDPLQEALPGRRLVKPSASVMPTPGGVALRGAAVSAAARAPFSETVQRTQRNVLIQLLVCVLALLLVGGLYAYQEGSRRPLAAPCIPASEPPVIVLPDTHIPPPMEEGMGASMQLLTVLRDHSGAQRRVALPERGGELRGEPFWLELSSPRDAYVYVFWLDPQRRPHLLYPNAEQRAEIGSDAVLRVPEGSAQFEAELNGEYEIVAAFSAYPLDELVDELGSGQGASPEWRIWLEQEAEQVESLRFVHHLRPH
ncbi:MAG: CHAT domain-containing protein [Myxococcota bacterium]|jgi:hypothetical protein|nr:CHAT domain-containing protein [Myxococcota bacterium]